ncbi:MAG TPA: tRNA-dihydrouridine synthase family protein [Syntrophorhabdaceae bacterium]|nr:tRNA-dihydrouridine synthase family protein [Syntrophorhabdaceae bacterium]
MGIGHAQMDVEQAWTGLRHVRQDIVLRDLTISPPLILAPMAGLTHSALRQVIAGFGGAGLLSTEMLSARHLPDENPCVSPCLVRSSLERPLSYQLLVASVADVGAAIEKLHQLRADAVDINMGCPVRSINSYGAGAALMENPGNVRSIILEARRRTSLPLTAKIRLGIELDDAKLKSFCRMLEGEGIDMISIHARLKKESFARRPKWEYISRIKEWINIPVIANGGIFSVQDARDCLVKSGADGLMIGRGAAVKPWLFADIAHEVYERESMRHQVSYPMTYCRYTDLLDAYRPERRLGRLKEFTHYFAANFTFGHQLSCQIQNSKSVTEAREKALSFFQRHCN